MERDNEIKAGDHVWIVISDGDVDGYPDAGSALVSVTELDENDYDVDVLERDVIAVMRTPSGSAEVLEAWDTDGSMWLLRSSGSDVWVAGDDITVSRDGRRFLLSQIPYNLNCAVFIGDDIWAETPWKGGQGVAWLKVASQGNGFAVTENPDGDEWKSVVWNVPDVRVLGWIDDDEPVGKTGPSEVWRMSVPGGGMTNVLIPCGCTCVSENWDVPPSDLGAGIFVWDGAKDCTYISRADNAGVCVAKTKDGRLTDMWLNEL